MHPAETALRRSWVSSLRWVPFLSISTTKESWMEAPKGNCAVLLRRCCLHCSTPTVFSVLKHSYMSIFSLPFSIHFLSLCDSDSSPSASHCCLKWTSCLTVKRQNLKCSVQHNHAFYCWWVSNKKQQYEVTPAIVMFKPALYLVKNTTN